MVWLRAAPELRLNLLTCEKFNIARNKVSFLPGLADTFTESEIKYININHIIFLCFISLFTLFVN